MKKAEINKLPNEEKTVYYLKEINSNLNIITFVVIIGVAISIAVSMFN